jgi:hypothetical protein
MPNPDFGDLIEKYAMRGLRDWSKADPDLKRRASRLLANKIAENAREVREIAQVLFNEIAYDKLRFVPMPSFPAKQNSYFERAFLGPIGYREGNAHKVSFDLFLMVRDGQCLAFRFEPGHATGQTHDYAHLQLSRKLLRDTLEVVGIPDWLPVSYPAFPVHGTDPVTMFLCVAAAVHGHSLGAIDLLKEIYAGQPLHEAMYIEQLKTSLVMAA